MKVKLRLCIAAMCLIFLSGCSVIERQDGDMIAKPKNTNIAIKGTWEIVKYKIVNEKLANKAALDNLIGKTMKFGSNVCYFDQEATLNPEYKTINTLATYYFVHYYGINPKNLDIASDRIDIISIYSSDKLFHEIIPIDENSGMMYYDGAFIYIDRISQEEPSVESDTEKIKEITYQDSKSGLLLGLGTELFFKNEEVNSSEYRTLWISWSNDSLQELYSIDEIIIPRARGFWTLGMNRLLQGEKVYETISARDINGHSEDYKNSSINQDISRAINENRYINVTFVGTDYITVEAMYIEEGKPNKKILKAIPLDNLDHETGVKIVDIVGNVGKTVIEQSASGAKNSISSELREVLEAYPKEDSISLSRRNGHWILIGRINSDKEEYRDKYLDFNINIIPPSKLVSYDQLFVSWNKVKERVPDALDVYTSPNQDFAVVLTSEEVLVYKIHKGELLESPIKTIALKEGESAIMAQWSKGDQVTKWNDVIVNMGDIIED